MSFPTPQEMSHYVLREVGEPGTWLKPGSFWEHLVKAALAADTVNLTFLADSAFGDLADVVRLYRQDPDQLIELTGMRDR